MHWKELLRSFSSCSRNGEAQAPNRAKQSSEIFLRKCGRLCYIFLSRLSWGIVQKLLSFVHSVLSDENFERIHFAIPQKFRASLFNHAINSSSLIFSVSFFSFFTQWNSRFFFSPVTRFYAAFGHSFQSSKCEIISTAG